MVAWWAHAAKRRGHFTVDDQVSGMDGRPGCTQCGGHRERVHVGVGVEGKVALGWRCRQNFLYIQHVVCPAQLLFRGQRRVVRQHVVKQPFDQQVILNGSQALRALGVVGTHFVTGAVWVCDVGAEQGSLLFLGVAAASTATPHFLPRNAQCFDLSQAFFNVSPV
jgi:hypothetical protein